MKKIYQVVIFIMLTAVFNICVSSCSSSDDYSSPIKGKTVSDVTFEWSQGTSTITIGDADLTGFEIKSYEPWCIVSAQGKNLNISVQTNITYDERQARVEVTDPGDQSTVSFMVVQKQYDDILLEKRSYAVPEDGGEISVNLKSNIKYDINIPADASWLTVASKSSTRGLENSTIVLKASKNDSGDERKAWVELTNKSLNITQKFSINQDFTPSVSLDIDEIEVDEAGGEIQVSVTSNTSINTSYSDDWLSNGGREETGGFNFIQKIKVSALPKNSGSRNAKVEFSDKLGKWNISKVVIIKQVKNLSIIDSDVKLYVGDSYTLNVVNNTGASLSWKSSNTSVATVNNSGKVTGVSKGSATITVTSADGTCSDNIDISVIDFSDQLSYFCNAGFESIVTSLGAWSGYFVSCQLSNNSKKDIILNKCDVYKGSTYIDTQNLNSELKAGSSETVKLRSKTGINGSYTFVWSYSLNGKSYTLRCESPVFYAY